MTVTPAQPASPRPDRPRVALALGGGAALGWTHIGILRALDDAGIAIAAVAGTSIGGLAALCSAADRLDIFEQVARSATRISVLRYLDPHMKKGAVLGGRRIRQELIRYFGSARIEQLPIPTAVVGSDLDRGEPFVIDHGPIVDAAMATISLPGLFAPVRLHGRVLIDGGATMPVPVAPVRRMALGVPVIGVNLQARYQPPGDAPAQQSAGLDARSTLDVVRAATGIALNRLARFSLDLDPPDIELAPPVGHVDVADFTRADELIAIGRETVASAMPEIWAIATPAPRTYTA